MSARSAESTRRLATVLAADAVGFSRRMGTNERATIAAVLECRVLMSEVVSRYYGTTAGTPGDFFLAVMPSSLQAVEAALELQSRLASRNLAVDDAHRVEYRIGIGIGDIYEHGGDILGDAVNVAARLQAIAPTGGVVVSGTVRDVAGASEAIAFEYLGDQALKNIVAPVRAFAVSRKLQHGPDVNGSSAAPVRDRLADRLPIKPVVEVAPFQARGGSEEEKLFADGLAEELVSILAGLSNSLVVRQIGRPQSDAVFAGASDIPRLYRLGGSVRRTADAVRIVAQLTIQGSGEAIWSDRFDYTAGQAFDAQEIIAREVVTSIQVTLTEGDQARLWHTATPNVRAWELFQRGHDMEQRFTRHCHGEARRYYEAAIARDPEYVSAIIALAFCHLDEIRLGWTGDVAHAIGQAETLYERARSIKPDEPECLALLAYIELHRRQDGLAVAAMEQAVKLAPRSSELAAYLGTIYHTVGRYQDAIVAYRRAMRLNSHYPAWIASNLGFAQCIVGKLHEARMSFLGVVTHHADYVRAHLGLAVAYRRLGLMEDARAAAAEVLRLDPLFSVEQWAQDRPYADAAVTDAFAADMRAAGLP